MADSTFAGSLLKDFFSKIRENHFLLRRFIFGEKFKECINAAENATLLAPCDTFSKVVEFSEKFPLTFYTTTEKPFTTISSNTSIFRN